MLGKLTGTLIGSLLLFAAPAMASQVPEKAVITYKGTYKFTQGRKERPRARRNIGLGDLLGKALQGDAISGGTVYEGAITIKATFDGAAVIAQVTGTGGISHITYTGLIQGDRCRMVDSKQWIVFEGTCSTAGFDGAIFGTERFSDFLKGNFSSTASELVDVGKADAQAAVRNQERDEKRAALKKLCDAGKNVACVEMDTLD